MKRPGFNRVWLPDCWWFRNPKANHRFGCIKPVVNNGINDRSLNWWVKTGFLKHQRTSHDSALQKSRPLSWAFFEPRTSLVTRKTQKERGQVENGEVSRRTFGCSKILWNWNLDGQWDLWSLKIKMNWKHFYVGSVFCFDKSERCPKKNINIYTEYQNVMFCNQPATSSKREDPDEDLDWFSGAASSVIFKIKTDGEAL